ncbi:hypothetical protein GBAR_LOCUS30086 [Geodia barretti]|uniref:Uncharacterized protein n=1 Tax=Geodia barretti TaxID=519541 RepID=A0AA35TVB7_GEOBA|nr:hypothetical protein GBAR_LOCUS30086 [Geodia barretti]
MFCYHVRNVKVCREVGFVLQSDCTHLRPGVIPGGHSATCPSVITSCCRLRWSTGTWGLAGG